VTLLLSFDDPLAGRIEQSGGKGANLSTLTRRGFPVPPGFIVTAQAYREFAAAGGEILKGVARLPFDDAQRLKSESEELRDALSRLPLPPSLPADVRSSLQKFPPNQAFSVRSSSTMEDLAGAAFAGQHDTYLNCIGADVVLEKIKSCFLSLWQDRAVSYRHKQGFDHLAAAMAVVVQSMVPCEVAGVAFTINPITGDLKEMIVSANYGLGESIVSGEEDVDHFALERPGLKRRSSVIARKSRKVVSAAGGGTREVDIPEEEANLPCLDDSQLARLAELFVKVEESYGFPQDIEWGIEGGRLHLLQSRPITAIPPRWTRDESAERFPNVITPLTWDFVEEGFHKSLAVSFRLLGFPPFAGKWFGMHGHYVYGNQNAVDLYGRRAPVAVRSVAELKAAIPQLREHFRWVQDLPVRWSRDLDSYLIRIGRFLETPLADRDLKGVWAFVQEVSDLGTSYFEPNIAISIAHGGLCRLLFELLKMALGETEGRARYDDLTAFCDTKTGAINREMFEMACRIRAEPALEKTVAGNESRAIVERNLLRPFPAFAARFAKFLDDHGHRETDFDMYHPTWAGAPWLVLENVKLILGTPLDLAPAGKERELKMRMQVAEYEILKRIPQDLHFFFTEIARLARTYTSLDDLEHYQTTRLTVVMRKGLLELDARLRKRGLLDEPSDIFFARRSDIDVAVHEDRDARWKEFTDAVRKEKAAYLKDKARRPEWVLGSAASESTAEDHMTGLPGSPGQAEGPVFIVLTPEDFARFPKGAVLVARTTNPTWTPLFYSAAAVIAESGGPLSHGAVTAREMQIPAVMSVHGCLSRLSNGLRVRVDGSQGRVYISR